MGICLPTAASEAHRFVEADLNEIHIFFQTEASTPEGPVEPFVPRALSFMVQESRDSKMKFIPVDGKLSPFGRRISSFGVFADGCFSFSTLRMDLFTISPLLKAAVTLRHDCRKRDVHVQNNCDFNVDVRSHDNSTE